MTIIKDCVTDIDYLRKDLSQREARAVARSLFGFGVRSPSAAHDGLWGSAEGHYHHAYVLDERAGETVVYRLWYSTLYIGRGELTGPQLRTLGNCLYRYHVLVEEVPFVGY